MAKYVKNQLDTYMSRGIEAKTHIGLSFAFYENGRPSFWNYGYQNLDGKQLFDENSIVEIVSIGKVFTALLFAKLMRDDLALRKDTSDRQSVTTCFRKLVEKFGNKKGYTVLDLRDLVVDVSGRANGKSVIAFDDYFIGAKPIPTRALMRKLGIKCVKKTKRCILSLVKNPKLRMNLFSVDGTAT